MVSFQRVKPNRMLRDDELHIQYLLVLLLQLVCSHARYDITIAFEPPLFGGFYSGLYSGKNCNYITCG